MKLFASIASADPLNLAGEIRKLNQWPWLHFDIEDGNFTPNLTFGQKTLASVGKFVAPRQLDVHLMTTNPLAFLEAVHGSGAASVCAHLETLRFPLLFLNRARQMGLKAGLALNLGTPLSAAAPFMEALDYLLVMTAEPDGQGERLSRTALTKAITAARELPVQVMADGALDEGAVSALAGAGAAGCVLGRLVFGASTPHEKLETLLRQTKLEGGTSVERL